MTLNEMLQRIEKLCFSKIIIKIVLLTKDKIFSWTVKYNQLE